MHIEALIARYGTWPPASGPARTAYCAREGLLALREARTAWGKSLRGISVLFPYEISSAPLDFDLDVAIPPSFSRRRETDRVARWFAAARRISQTVTDDRLQGGTYLAKHWEALEELSRAALHSACSATLWFADAKLDDFEQVNQRAVSQLFHEAHALSHRVGELVGGLFGCKIVEKDGRWMERCELSLLHVPIGNSIGFTAVMRCSICHEDVSECEHLPGLEYDVEVAATDQGCSVCRAECSHQPGETYSLLASSYASDLVLREVSLVARPRDPLCRVTGREVESERIRAQLGRSPSKHETVLDHGCMYFCQGFEEADLN